jgi:hypothetical protein
MTVQDLENPWPGDRMTYGRYGPLRGSKQVWQEPALDNGVSRWRGE